MSATAPSTSVIVPTRERLDRLGSCLAALARLDYAGSLQVVVADDGDVPLEPLLEPHREQLEIAHVRTGGRGPAAARNAGAGIAEGDLLAFTDDDCEPEPGWLAALAPAVIERDDVIAGGRTVNALADNPFSETSQAITDAVYDHYNPDPGRAGFLAANNIALRADGFRALGGFDERFALAAGEDRNLCERWLENGGTLQLVADAVIRHSHDLGPLDFWRQHYGYGRGTNLERRLRAERGRPFELAPAATSGILSTAARTALSERRASRLPLLVVWQLANAAGFARQSLAPTERASASSAA